MAKTRRPSRKEELLRAQGALHPHPQDVTDPLFAGSIFFDPRDLVQVKYEMLRRVRTDRLAISTAAASFGLSRPVFYHAQEAFGQSGVPGLIRRKPGPRRAHKLTDAVVAYLAKARVEDPALHSADLVALARERFGLQVHPRSIERRLARLGQPTEKKPRA